MGREDYLIDTNVIIDYFGQLLPEKVTLLLDQIIDNRFYISVINKIELLGFSGLQETEENIFQEFVRAAEILNLNEDVIDMTISLRRNYRIKLPDAIIAATALVYDLVLLTRNIKDFSKIGDLKIPDLYTL